MNRLKNTSLPLEPLRSIRMSRVNRLGEAGNNKGTLVLKTLKKVRYGYV